MPKGPQARRRSVRSAFDKEQLAEVPAQPGVYRVYDERGTLIYVGKSKNLRRRLGQYRNAKRRKKHLKMRKIVSQAVRLEYDLFPTDLAASLAEADWIQRMRPRWNVAGAFFFLYPLVGIRRDGDRTWFVCTTRADRLEGFQIHGAFRSRSLTDGAFAALVRLLSFVGHPVLHRGNSVDYRLWCFRGIPSSWLESLAAFFRGESSDSMTQLVLALTESRGARRVKREVQECLDALDLFRRHEANSLREARRRAGCTSYPVMQKERDLLFLRSRSAREAAEAARRSARRDERARPQSVDQCQ